MKKRALMALGLAAVMTLTACGQGGGTDTATTTAKAGETEASAPSGEKPEKTYTLKVSTTQNDSSAIVKGLYEISKQVEQQTNGGLKIEIYPASQLGGEEDMIEQALQGVNVAVLTDAARMSNYVKDIGILNMAYFVDNYDEACQVMDTETFQGWQDQLVDNGIRVLCFNFYDGARSFMTHKEAKVPGDLKGQVIRTPGADPWVYSIEALGATAYNVAWSEVYNSIQTNAIDGCEVQYTSAVSTAIYEVCEYVNKTEHINLVNCLVTGETWFSTLPKEYQDILTEVAYACAYDNAKYVESLQPEMEKTLTDNGMKVVEVDKEAFKEAAKTAYDKMGWTELRAQIYSEIGKAN